MSAGDKPIKNKVDSYASEIDVNEIWAAIEPEVDAINAERRIRRFIPFFWLFGVLALGLSVGGYYMWANDSAEAQLSNVTPASTPIESQIAKEISSADALNLVESTSAQALKETVADEVKSIEKTTSINAELPKIENNINNPISPKFHFVKPTPNPTQQAQSNATPKSGSAFDLPVDTDESANQIPVAQTTNNLPSLSKALHASASGRVELRGLIGELNKGIIALDLLGFEALAVSDEELDLWPFYELPEADKRKRNKKKPLQYSVSASAGAAFVIKKLTTTSTDQERLDFLSDRLATEKPLEAQNYGFKIKLKRHENWSFTTGLNRTQITELYESNHTTINTFEDEGIVTRVIQLNGDTLDFLGPVEEVITTTYNQKIYNRYVFWEVPVLFGYEKQYGDWSIGGQAGVFVIAKHNANATFKNNVYGEQNLPNPIAGLSSRTEPFLSYYLGAEIRRKLGDNLSVTLSPYYKKQSASVLSKNSSISQKYSLIGADLSVGWKF